MFKNYVKIAARNFYNHKAYSFINIIGLAVGIACCILIFLWVQDELSYDHFHEKSSQIYRVVFADESYDKIRHYSVTPPALAAALKSDYPDVIYSTKYVSMSDMLVRYGENIFRETIAFADSSLFNIFTLPFLSGNSHSAFLNPNSIVITEQMAVKYFGSANPMYQSFTIDNRFDFIVTGILKNLPTNGYLNFDFLTQFEHLEDLTGRGNVESWDNFGYNTFILLSEKSEVNKFNEKISDFAIKAGSYGQFKPRLYLQPLTDIHLRDLNGGGAITYVYIFALIALFVLLIACINFMNLSTARSTNRSKEVGLRKMVGANKLDIIKQFYGESILLSLLAFLLSLFMVEMLLSNFNRLAGKELSLGDIFSSQMLIIIFALILFTGIFAGSYPALFLSSFKTITVLKGRKISSSILVRKILVVLQFSLSIVLIICTIFMAQQLKFLNRQNLGFEKDQVLYIPLNRLLKEKLESVKSELLQHSQILKVTATSSKIGIKSLYSVDLDRWEGNDGEKRILLYMISTDEAFLKTFDMEIIEGRYYSPEYATDSLGVVLNETALKEMGLLDPIGKTIFDRHRIIGVVKDFNFQSLHSRIKPLALLNKLSLCSYMAVKIATEDVPSTLSHLEDIIEKFSPGFPFEYYFLDEEFDNIYRSEQRLGTLFKYFSIISIFISCLGLFGLISFMAEQRTKEIGIRKVLGATISGIILLLTRDFTKWILLANLFAWPIAYVFMSEWLQNFAYRISLHPLFFILSGLMALAISFVTIGYQTVKAALHNPIRSLRYE